MQSAKWKREFTELEASKEKAGTRSGTTPVTVSSGGLALPTSSDSVIDSPTVSMMEDVDLMRQVDLLTLDTEVARAFVRCGVARGVLGLSIGACTRDVSSTWKHGWPHTTTTTRGTA